MFNSLKDNYLQQNLFNKIYNPKHVLFSFLFASLITPFLSANLKFFFQSSSFSKKKIFLKQSYLILVWFYYMETTRSYNINNKLRFFFLPIRNQVYTLTKAPIAHKTWSKEQYKFHFFLIRISFNNNYFFEEKISDLNQVLLFFFTVKKFTPYFSSNLLLIKNFRIILVVSDKVYFKYR